MRLMEGKDRRNGRMKLFVAKSGLASDHLIMKSNYRQAQQGSLFSYSALFLFIKEGHKT